MQLQFAISCFMKSIFFGRIWCGTFTFCCILVFIWSLIRIRLNAFSGRESLIPWTLIYRIIEPLDEAIDFVPHLTIILFVLNHSFVSLLQLFYGLPKDCIGDSVNAVNNRGEAPLHIAIRDRKLVSVLGLLMADRTGADQVLRTSIEVCYKSLILRQSQMTMLMMWDDDGEIPTREDCRPRRMEANISIL